MLKDQTEEWLQRTGRSEQTASRQPGRHQATCHKEDKKVSINIKKEKNPCCALNAAHCHKSKFTELLMSTFYNSYQK